MIEPSAGWLEFIKEFATRSARKKTTAILIGGPDSGKSTFARFAVEFLVSRKNPLPLCLIDADVGQTSIGLPGAISMKRFSPSRWSSKNPWPDKMIFIGSVNPAMRIPEMIDGVKWIAGCCGKKSAALVDTTGLVSGYLGRALKLGKIKALKPDYIVAIQKEDELAHILGAIPKGPKIIRFKPSPATKKISRVTRINYRKERYSEYFSAAGVLKIPLGKIRFYYRNTPLDLSAPEFKPEQFTGNIAGLNKGPETIALGVLKGIEKNRALFLTPLKSAAKINNVLFGDIFV